MNLGDAAPRLRSRIERTFSDTVIVRRHGALTTDNEGNGTSTLVVVDTIKGEWLPPQPSDLEVAAQAGQRLDAILKIAYDADVRPGDIVEVNGTWRVGNVRPGRVQARAHLVSVDA